MAAKRYRELLEAWALHRLGALGGGYGAQAQAPARTARAKAPTTRAKAAATGAAKAPAPPTDAAPGGEAIAVVVARFGLAERERRVLELAFAVESVFAVGRVARAAAGAAGLTVELVREALGVDVDAVLSPAAA